MKKIRRFQFPGVVIGLGILLAGCGGTKVRPEVKQVRKVAIVSLYAEQVVPWYQGKIWTTGEAPKGQLTNFDPQTKQRVATDAYAAFSSEFQRIGWSAIPMAQVTGNALYQKLFGPPQANADSNVLVKAASYVGNNKLGLYFTAPGLFPIEWSGATSPSHSYTLDASSFSFEKKKDLKTELAELAAALGVDAVALVYLDYCYTGSFTIVGPEKAKITAGSWMKIVNRDKAVVLSMDPPRNRCEGSRGESQSTVPMFKGSITIGRYLLADALTAAFIEASKASAKLTGEQISAAIAKAQ